MKQLIKYNLLNITMDFLNKTDSWPSGRQFLFIDLLRFTLGVYVFSKGILLAEGINQFSGILLSESSLNSEACLVHYIVFGHLIGGLLIAIGLLTRLAALVNIPAVFVTLLSIAGDNPETNRTNLFISVVALMALIFFLAYGPGKFSTDEYLRSHREN